MSKSQILEDYLNYRRISNNTEKKIKDIERDIRRFMNYSSKPLSKFNEKDLISFINSLDFQIRTMNELKINLKNFIKWYYEDYSQRFRNLDRVCRSQTPPKAYKPEQMLKEVDIKKLVQGTQELFWKVFLLLLFYGGFRPIELITLKWNQVYFEQEGTIIKVFSNKNKKTFIKAIPFEVEHFLKEWKKYNHSEWVFPSPKNIEEHIGPKTPYFAITNLSKKVLNKKINPYLIRHSVATIKYNSNLKDDIIAQQMGHSKSMKQTYTNLNEEEIKANARLIWVRAKELPPERKHELELKIEQQDKKIEMLLKHFSNYQDVLNDISEGNKVYIPTQTSKESKQIKKEMLDYINNH